MGRIEYRIKAHDKYQFELKLDYELDMNSRSDTYRIETFFFLPASLGVNRLSYPKDLFYRDLLSYTRYKTPAMSFEQLMDESNRLSPLVRLSEYLSRYSGAGAERKGGEEPRVVYELKMLGAIVKSAARDESDFICRRLKELPLDGSAGAEKAADIEHIAGAFLEKTEKFLSRFRALRRGYLSPRVPDSWREAFDVVDEAMSVQIERAVFQVGRAMEEKASAHRSLEKWRDEIRRHIAREIEHRKGAGYPSVLEGADEDRKYEAYLYRLGALKKFCGSALYLSASTDPAPSGLTHILYGTAAAVAMAFALVVSLVFLKAVPSESIAFFMAAVLAYAFKDRIKDAMKGFFTRRMAWALPDRKTFLRDRGLGGKVVGVSREAMSFMDRNAVPPDVAACRARPGGILDEEAEMEQVFKYEKDITAYPLRIKGGHVRVRAINEILRFCIRHFLYKMDEPVKAMPDLEGDDLARRLLLAKVYHVNVVFRFSYLDGDRLVSQTEKLRLILDRNGIRRMETGRGETLAVE